MKFKEVFLLILIVAAGVFFYHAQTGKINISFDWDEGLFFAYEEFVFQESKDLAPPFPGDLQVINKHGDIIIEGSDQDNIQILFTKKIRRRNEEEAKEISDRLGMIINEKDSRITISTNRNNFTKKRFRTDFHILIPASMNIWVKNSYGLVEAVNTGTADIFNPHGKVKAADIKGSLVLQNSYKDVFIEKVLFDCQVESRHSAVSVCNIKGSTLIVNRYGKIYCDDLSQDTIIEGTHSEIFAKNLYGPVDIESSYKEIILSDTGSINIRGNHSPIEIQNAQGIINISSNYSHIKLDNIEGNLEIMGKSTGVYGKYIRGNNIYINTSYKNVTLEDFAAKTSIALSNGDINLTPAPLTHTVEVKAAYSSIEFFWPGKEQYLFEAQIKNGDIQWNLPDEPSVQINNGHSIVKAFRDKEANKAIKLSTSYGKIVIEENQDEGLGSRD